METGTKRERERERERRGGKSTGREGGWTRQRGGRRRTKHEINWQEGGSEQEIKRLNKTGGSGGRTLMGGSGRRHKLRCCLRHGLRAILQHRLAIGFAMGCAISCAMEVPHRSGRKLQGNPTRNRESPINCDEVSGGSRDSVIKSKEVPRESAILQ